MSDVMEDSFADLCETVGTAEGVGLIVAYVVESGVLLLLTCWRIFIMSPITVMPRSLRNDLSIEGNISNVIRFSVKLFAY